MIEKSIAKWSARLLIVLTAFTIAFLYFYPKLYERHLLSERSEYEAILKTNSPIAGNATNKNPDDVVELLEELNGQLKMEIPEDVDKDAIQVENDYLTQTVYIRFGTECTDYFSDYRMLGSSDCITSIYYYRKSGTGIMALQLSKFYEVDSRVESDGLYLTFTDPHDIYDKVILVDAGHGQGSIGGATMRGIKEQDINLAITLYLKELFDASEENIGVYYTRLDDVDPALQDRVGMANALEADLFISIHNNAFISDRWSSINGTSVLYSQSDNSEHSSKQFARICLNNLVDILGSNNRGLSEGDNIYIVRTSNVPVALVEVGFMTNRAELDNLVDENYQRLAAQGLYNAVIQAFEEGF